MSKKHYDGNQIQILENLEPVRLRPGMYVGDTGSDGLHHILEEVVSNAVDEFMDGHVTSVAVKIDTEKQIVTVIDNGRGIPVSKHKKTKLPLLTAVFTKLHSGGKFGHGAYTSAVAGLHGIGIKATNALSERLSVWTVQNDKVYHQAFQRGEPVTQVRVDKKKKMKVGTRVQFLPDFSIFKDATFDPKRIQRRLEALAYLCPGLTLWLRVDNEAPRSFHAEGGLSTMLADALDGRYDAQHAPFSMSTDQVEVSLAWTDREGSDQWTSFVNATHTPENGTHVNGVKKALQKVLVDHADKKLGKLRWDDIRDGLVGIVHAHVLEPEFRGQTKRSLRNRDVEESIRYEVENEFRKFASTNQAAIKTILERAVMVRDAKKKLREQQKAIRGIKVQKGARGILPGKLCEAPDCSSDDRELYIVEGDSAFGTVKPARITQKDGKHFQEILPLRGKVLNAARKGGVDEVLKNSELSNITQAIGTSIGPAFNLDKCRYKAIYLLMDADSDGKHIQALLLAFFAKFMPQLIEDGRLYVVESPLFMGVTSKQRVYGDTADEVKDKLGNPKKVRIARFKGLGESQPKDLRAYAMHPKTRALCHVLWGGKRDQDLVLKYMGLDATARKELLGIIE